MKEYVIIPANNTEGMYGYSAIAIEKNFTNIDEVKTLIEDFIKVKDISKEISTITYNNPKLDILLLNDDFEPNDGGIIIQEIDDKDLEKFLEERDCRVISPSIAISNDEWYITYEAKYSDAEVYGKLEQKDLVNLLIL